MNMKERMNWLIQEESGQSMVEYALIFALIVIIVIGALKLLGVKTLDLYEDASNNI